MTARLPVFGREPPRRWMPDAYAVLDATPSNVEAAERLGRTVAACETRRRALRADGAAEPARALPNAWTPEDDALLLGSLPDGEIRKRTGRSFAAIRARRNRLRGGGR